MVKSPRRSVIFRKSFSQSDLIVGRDSEDIFTGASMWIDSIEAISFRALNKLGYDYTSNGKYFKVDNRWVHRSLLSKDQCDGLECDLLYKVLLKDIEEVNSEVVFISTIVKLTYFGRLFLIRLRKKENLDALEAFVISAQMMAEFMYWREEFPLGQWIAPTKQQRAGRKVGGEMVGAKTAREAVKRHTEWQMWSDDVWSASPNLSKMAVAKHIRHKHSIEFEPETIARIIKKNGSS